MTTADHDPGAEAARTRAARVPLPHATPVPVGSGVILTGTAGWTDPSLTAAGVFYPGSADSAETRLRYYADRFPIVEVDSPYYALPSRRSAELWVERTPDDFTFFDVKANALMTGQPSEVKRLPREPRDALPEALRRKTRIYGKDLPAELLDAKARLGEYRVAVEFRNRRWLTERTRERTLGYLTEHDLAFVMVDGPQGLESSIPPIRAVTSGALGVLRLHGRRAETWERAGVGVAERFRYLYDTTELAGWVPELLAAARETRRLHVIHNNCYANYGTTNALELTRMLADAARLEG